MDKFDAGDYDLNGEYEIEDFVSPINRERSVRFN